MSKEDENDAVNSRESDDEEFPAEILAKNTNKRRKYDISFKLDVVRYATKHGVRKAAKEYNIGRSSVQDWTKQSCELEEMSVNSRGSKKCRLSGAGRPVADETMERKVIEWIRKLRSKKLRVTRSSIQTRAMQISDNPDFKASNGWLQSFLGRHNLVARRATTVCQKPPEEFIDKIVDFLVYTQNKIDTSDYQYVFAADETAVYLDSSKTLTVDSKGAKEVAVKSTGHDKFHVCVMLTARNDGYKCRPFVLLPNKRVIPAIVQKFGKHLELSWCGRTFFDDACTSEYLKSVIGHSLFGKRLLVWDSYRCHKSVSTKNVLKSLKIDVGMIPGGTTKFLQAPDVFWNSSFKASIRKRYEDWMVHGVHTFTDSGNMRAPPMSVYLQWIVDAWEEMPKDLIVSSFVGCGISQTNDRNDNEIHCFKSEDLSTGLDRLIKKREELAPMVLDEPSDHESDEELCINYSDESDEEIDVIN